MSQSLFTAYVVNGEHTAANYLAVTSSDTCIVYNYILFALTNS